MKKILIEAGHNAIDPGASGHGFTEYQEAKKDKVELIRNLGFQLQHRKDVTVIPDVDTETLAQTINRFKKHASPEGITLSIHYNAVDNQSVRGVEVWVRKEASAKEVNVAKKLTNAYAKMLQIPDRGVKYEHYNRWGRLGILHTGSGLNFLMEVDFISHPEAIEHIESMRERLHAMTATILINALEK